MDSLGESIALACPAAFSGSSGALFINAITTVIAAHCSITADHQWPMDNSEEILRNTEGAMNYDFIVVGAGTAGSIVAGGLAERFPSQSVLLIESGDDPGVDSEIPGLMFLNQNGKNDWNYKTEPDGRSCLGFRNKSCTWSKGRAMGGSGSINAMLYIRGHPNDYDNWNQNGITGWSYDDLKPYFEKVEHKIQYDNCKIHLNPLDEMINKAWSELGFEAKNNYKAEIGTKKNRLLTRNGRRLNTAKIYLKERSNLNIMKNTFVRKLNIDESSRTVKSVEIYHASGIIKSISVKKEVILSAGSIGTPQLLMHSGIGPVKTLEPVGIKCLSNIPVGKNLQDHILLPIYLKTNLHTALNQYDLASYLLQYMMTQTGPFSNLGITDFMGFINTGKSSNYPDIQFHHSYFTHNDEFILAPYLKELGYRYEIIKEILLLNNNSDLLGIYPTLIHPKSRGEIKIYDTKSKPVIIANYFEDELDLRTFIKSIDFVRRLVETDSFKSLGIELSRLNIPECSIDTESDEYWECYIRNMATTIYHPVGTAKMSLDPEDGVVNAQLLVHGFHNIRVVDASIMPNIPSSNTMAPTMAIAEKAVDIIANYYKYKVRSDL